MKSKAKSKSKSKSKTKDYSAIFGDGFINASQLDAFNN